MRNLKPPIPFDIHVTRIAVLQIFIGVTVLLSTVWAVAGGVVVMLGLATLWLAHQVAIAPCYHEPADLSLSSAQVPDQAR